MKRYMLMLSALMVNYTLSAQILHPVKWAYAAKKINKNEAVILIKATIEQPWHIYSIHQKDGGPVKTSFTFEKSAAYELKGTMVEPGPITKYENSFSMDVHYFEKSVVFQQKIKLNAAHPVIKGSVSFMTCNDRKCLPPDDVDFIITVK